MTDTSELHCPISRADGAHTEDRGPCDDPVTGLSRADLIEALNPRDAVERSLADDIVSVTLESARLKAMIAVWTRMQEPDALAAIGRTFFGAGSGSAGGGEINAELASAYARREPHAANAVGATLASACLDGFVVTAAATRSIAGEVAQAQKLIGEFETRRRRLLRDLADYRRGVLGGDPAAIADYDADLREALSERHRDGGSRRKRRASR